MLEVLYNTATKEVRAWCGDEKQLGNLKLKEGQEVVIFPLDPPAFESDIYFVDLANKEIGDNPDYMPIKPFNPKTETDDLKARIASGAQERLELKM